MKLCLKYAAIGLMMLNLTACNSPLQQTTTIDLPIVNPDLPEPPVLNAVDWKIYDADDLKQLSSSTPSVILFTLTPVQSTILSDNLVEMQRYILQLKQTVIYYQTLNTPQ